MCEQEDRHALHSDTVLKLTTFYRLKLLLLLVVEEVVELVTKHHDEIVAPSIECFKGSVSKVVWVTFA